MNIETNRDCYKYMVEIGLVENNEKCSGEFDRTDKIYSKCLKCNFFKRERKCENGI